MSEWTRPAQPVRCVVELDKPLAVHRERGVLAQGDANANAIVAEVYSTAGKPYDLSGCTVQLIFVRPDNNALPAINAEISGNTATATLPDSAYAMSGMYSLRMQLRKNGAERTIVWIIGEVKGTDVDGIADPDHVISIGDIMASAKEAQTAASNANAAAQRANAGAERAEQLQIDASGLAGDSNKLGGKPPEYYLPVVQLLDNSDWRIKKNIINQRGLDQYVAAEMIYTIDRWQSGIWCEGTNVTVGDGYIEIYKNDVNNTGGTFYQHVPREKLVIGKTYTFAACLHDGRVFAKSFVMQNDNKYTDRLRYENILFATSGGTGHLRIMLIAASGSSAKLQWAALYEGEYTAETLPPFVPPDPTLELAKCQECYVWLGSDAGIYGYTGSAGNIYAFIPLPQSMRLKKVSLDANSKIFIAANGVLVGISEFMSQKMRGNQLELAAKANSNLPALTTFSGWVSLMGISADP